ncbi:MAG TPA: TetR/AcrR family transcriptional regulator [Spongiibacteraceae bacterium]|nr:TetR/AcrR family transcriptional regulator [Spongiibacteraceae bacterium]
MDTNVARVVKRESNTPKDLRRQEKMRQIVDAATEVFLEDGFTAASIDRIVEKAGVSKRTLYNYYPSKEEIFIDVMEKQLGAFYKYFEPSPRKFTTLEEELRQVGNDLLAIAYAPETIALFRNVAAEAQRFPKLASRFLEESCEKVIDGIAKIFEREGERAGLRIADTHEAAEHFLDLLGGAAYNRAVFGTEPNMTNKKIKARTEQALRYLFKVYEC